MANAAFVICQVGAEDSDIRRRADEIFEFIVRPVTDELDLVATRSDMDPTPGQVTAQIIRSLTSAGVVIADLTGRNPNVYYELGVAHSFGKPVVVLVDKASSLSFDTSTERVIEIGEGDRLGVAEAEKAKKKLREALRVVLKGDYVPASLVTEAAGTQSLDALAPENPIAQELGLVRDRVEAVLKQLGIQDHHSRFRDESAWLFSMVKRLSESGRLTTRTLEDAGIDLSEAPDDNGLRTGLVRVVPPPPPAGPADDDIPF